MGRICPFNQRGGRLISNCIEYFFFWFYLWHAEQISPLLLAWNCSYLIHKVNSVLSIHTLKH